MMTFWIAILLFISVLIGYNLYYFDDLLDSKLKYYDYLLDKNEDNQSKESVFKDSEINVIVKDNPKDDTKTLLIERVGKNFQCNTFLSHMTDDSIKALIDTLSKILEEKE